VSACPVGAIAPDTRPEPKQLPFIELNAAFLSKRETKPRRRQAGTGPRCPDDPSAFGRSTDGGDRRVRTGRDVRRRRTLPDRRAGNVFEKLPTPYGLVRAGWRRITKSTKRVTQMFDRIARRRGFGFYLNVEVGTHLSHADAAGTPSRRGSRRRCTERPSTRRRRHGSPGSGTATEMVAWINGHPDFTDLQSILGHERRRDSSATATSPLTWHAS